MHSCTRPDHEGWELIDSHGAGTLVYPVNTGRGIGTDTCEANNVIPPDDLCYGPDTNTNGLVIYMYIIFRCMGI